MAKLLKLRRGTTSQHSSFTGAEGEVTIDTTKDTAVVHDGSTAGGRPLLREDLDNMPASGVSAGTYGSSSAIPAITIDAKGRVTSATTSSIDSTSIANGTSNVAVANNGEITVTRAGSQKLTTKSDGVDVTGEVQCDTLDVDGAADISGNLTLGGNLAVGGTVDGRDVAADGTKLDGIESGAQVNVATNLGGSQAVSAVEITSSTGTNVTIQDATTTRAGVMTTAQVSKLNGIESGATADQTASEILTLIKTVDGAGSGLDADTLDGVSSADFLRNGNDTATGDITFSGGAGAVFLSADSDIRAATGNWSGEAPSNVGKIQYHNNNWYFQGHGSWLFRDGSGNARLLVDSSGNLTAQGNVTAYSDVTLKKDIETIPNALDKVLGMRGVNFTVKESDVRSTGVIAQEIEEQLPEVVMTDEEGIKSVAYGNVVGVLIEAIKELKAEIEELKGGN